VKNYKISSYHHPISHATLSQAYPLIHKQWKKRLGFLRLFPIIPDLLRLFATQPASNPSPKSKKQLKPSLIKMQIQLFFFYHTRNYMSFLVSAVSIDSHF
jgi:hypothetical protein